MSFIREAREKKGISLRELARRIGKSAAYVSDIELGRRNGGIETMKKIYKELGI